MKQSNDKYRSIIEEYDKEHNSFDNYLNHCKKGYLYPIIIDRKYDKLPNYFNNGVEIKFNPSFVTVCTINPLVR